MYAFNIIENEDTHERAYYVNGVRFNRETWRACMESEIENLEVALRLEQGMVEGYNIAIKAAQSIMDGKAAFELPENYRAVYRQVVSEIRRYQREEKNAVDEIIASIEDLTDKLED